MDLDLELGFFVFGVAIVTGLAVYFVSVFGVREKSFEEAIAEQKNRSELLLGVKPVKRVKVTKEKVNKVRKVRRQRVDHFVDNVVNIVDSGDVDVVENDVAIEEDNVEVVKHHVEILDEVEVFDGETSRRNSTTTSTPLKSILTNKSDTPPPPQITETMETEPINNFTLIHPKDDAELKSMATEKKKKQSPPNLQQLIQTTTLSNNEIQSLIDLLLNKESSTWSSSKKDSLKKQLEQKQQQLSEVEQNYQSLQKTLKELRSDYGNEKSRCNLFKIKLDEVTVAKEKELSELRIKLRQFGDVAMGKENEVLKRERLVEGRRKEVEMEMERVKGEVVKREMEWRGKVESLEREVGALKTQYGHQGNQLSSAFTYNEDLTKELSQLKELLLSAEATNKQLHHSALDKEKALLAELSARDALLSEREHTLSTAQLKNNNFEKLISEMKTKIDELSKNETNYKQIVSDLSVDRVERGGLEGELTLIKEKNDELRLKNSKLLESLKSTESDLELKSIKLADNEKKISHIFCELGIGECDLPALTQKLLQERLDFEQLKKDQAVQNLAQTDSASKFVQLQEDNVKLKEEVTHYQSVLASTESLLGNLQGSIEKEESKWREKLAEKEKQLEELMLNKSSLSELSELSTNGHEEDSELSNNNSKTSSPSTPPEKKKKKKLFSFKK